MKLINPAYRSQMIPRGLGRCIKCRTSCHTRWRRQSIQQRRGFSASSLQPPPANAQSPSSVLGSLTTELDKLAPRFEIHGEQVRLIRTPRDFYETLKLKLSNAQNRIYLSTLYVGKSEQELIDTIRDALRKNTELRVSILTDALRGTRESPKPSCASLLAPLIEEFGEKRVEIRMFHTPNLIGVRKAIVPRRINEGWGLQHMKLYGIDDEIMLSGANLSNDYFTNRQDRYHLFSSPELAEYFCRIHHAVCKLSFSVLPAVGSPSGYSMVWPSDNPAPSPLIDPKAFKKQATTILSSLMHPTLSNPKPTLDSPTTRTLIYPLFQFTPLLTPKDESTELPALRTLLGLLASPAWTGSTWTFTAGYFNMSVAFRRLLFRTVQSGVCSHGTVIAASPWANGFYRSNGVSGMLPDAYTLLSRRFLYSLSKRGLSELITLKEWRNGTVNEPEGWTYHAKGIWVTLPSSHSSPEKPPAGPSVSVVGSSNYTKRSYSLDLESNVMIVTQDPDLQSRLGEEEKWLQQHAKAMTKEDYQKPERQVGLRVRLAMWIVTILGGAL